MRRRSLERALRNAFDAPPSDGLPGDPDTERMVARFRASLLEPPASQPVRSALRRPPRRALLAAAGTLVTLILVVGVLYAATGLGHGSEHHGYQPPADRIALQPPAPAAPSASLAGTSSAPGSPAASSSPAGRPPAGTTPPVSPPATPGRIAPSTAAAPPRATPSRPDRTAPPTVVPTSAPVTVTVGGAAGVATTPSTASALPSTPTNGGEVSPSVLPTPLPTQASPSASVVELVDWPTPLVSDPRAPDTTTLRMLQKLETDAVNCYAKVDGVYWYHLLPGNAVPDEGGWARIAGFVASRSGQSTPVPVVPATTPDPAVPECGAGL